VPVFYNLLARFTKSPEAIARRIEAYEGGEQRRRRRVGLFLGSAGFALEIGDQVDAVLGAFMPA